MPKKVLFIIGPDSESEALSRMSSPHHSMYKAKNINLGLNNSDYDWSNVAVDVLSTLGMLDECDEFNSVVVTAREMGIHISYYLEQTFKLKGFRFIPTLRKKGKPYVLYFEEGVKHAYP